MKTQRHLILFLSFVAVVLTLAGWFYNRQNPQAVIYDTQQASQEVVTEEERDKYIFTADESGVTAFDLIEAAAEVETEDFGEAGQFVTSINGLAADNQHYWAFYVNNEYAQQGVSQTVLNQGDTIKFTYEEIDPTQL